MGWTFVTTHGLVLVEIAVNPRQTMRSLSEKLRVSERTVQSVIRDLVAEGYLTRTRSGRQNVYSVDRARRLRHPAVERHTVAELLRALG
ncbi:MAG: MarR family transcriptional regulator [Candidatus Limnocylindria bacterium]